MAYQPWKPKTVAEIMQMMTQGAQQPGLNTQTPGYFGQINMPVQAGPGSGYDPRNILPNPPPQQPPPPANVTPKNQKAAIIMGALSDIFKGQDTTQNTVLRQQQMVAMDAQRKAQERFNKAYENANPQMQKIMAGYSENPAAWDPIQAKLDIDKLTNTGAYAGSSLPAQYMNDLERGKDDLEYQKTSRYKVAYQKMHERQTYLDAEGRPASRPGLIPGTYPNPFPEDESNDGVIVGISQAERNKLISSNTAVDDATDRIKIIAKSIQEIDPNPLTFGTERAEIDSKYTQLQLELKNLFALGVLAGADLDLLEAVIGNPTDWKQFLIRGGKEGSLIQLQSLLEIANINKNRNLIKLGQETIQTPSLFQKDEESNNTDIDALVEKYQTK